VTRHLLTIYSQEDRERAAKYVRCCPAGTRVEFKAIKRTLAQSDLMWAMLTDISAQREHNGRKFTPDQWKVIMLAAIGREVQFIPSLDGKTFIPWGQSSSDLSREEMSDLISFMEMWGAENSVVFHHPREEAAA